MKQLTIIIRSSAYSNYLSEIQDLILAQSAFFDDINVLFTGNGILQLLENQKPPKETHKNFSIIYQTFQFYDIENIYLCEQSLNKLNIDKNKLLLNTQTLNENAIKQLIKKSDIVFNY